VPVIVGDPVHTKQLISDMLLDGYGIYVQPINFPTVPRGTERLRFTPSPVHDPKMLDGLVRAMDALWSHCALNRAETYVAAIENGDIEAPSRVPVSSRATCGPMRAISAWIPNAPSSGSARKRGFRVSMAAR
jgi:hypothetical protein